MQEWGLNKAELIELFETACTKLGYAGLTPDQEKAVKTFVSGRDLFITVVTKGIHGGEYQLVLISPESIISNLYWREML